MNTKKKTIKSILGCTTACSAMLLSGIGIMNLNSTKINVSAVEAHTIPVTISNSNFNQSTKTSYPYNPSSFTSDNNGSTADGNVDAGVVNLSHEKYETRFALAKRTSLDDYVLMIDSTKNGESSHSIKYGFKTSSNVKMDANSKYMLTVDVFNVTDANIASLYLFDKDGNVFSEIRNINSHNSWTTYTFFVSTDVATEVKLGMYLEGAGTVLFDNISCFKLSDSNYENSKSLATEGTFVEEDETDRLNRLVKSYNINNENYLTDGSNNISLTEIEYGSNNSTLSYVKDTDGQNENAIKIVNSEKTYAQYETDDIITLAPNRVYKVSVNVKTKELSGTATLQLIRTDLEENDENYNSSLNKTIKITSNTYSTSNSVTNDYKTYSFFINSHSTDNLTFKLKFGLGTTDELTSGEMYVSEIEVTKATYAEFSSASSENEKIDFVTPYKNNSIMLDNGNFNAFEIVDYVNPMPAKATSWEVTAGKHSQVYGVVNSSTFDDDLAHLNLTSVSKPSVENNNVLMMLNEQEDTLTYTSASKNLKANSYHKFELDVEVKNNAVLELALITKKDGNDIVLANKEIQASNVIRTEALYIHTGSQALDVSLKLTLKTDGCGYAYVDNTKFDFLLTEAQLKDEFDAVNVDANSWVADLSNIFTTTNKENFAKSNLFSTPEVLGVQSGFVTIKSNNLDDIIDSPEVLEGQTNLQIFNDVNFSNALVIDAQESANYTITSNIGYDLETNKYYKISVDVFTQRIDSNVASADHSKLGARIGLTGFDNSFTAIQSDNAWTTYTFYVNVDSAKTAYLEFSLGSEENKTKGVAFFGNVKIDDTLTEDDYDAVKQDDDFNKIVKPVKEENEETTPAETQIETSKNKSNINWLYLIPGLLTGAAIIIAIVGVLMRKVKWKNLFKKKSKTAYDRNKTVSVQYYARKATTMREEKVRELTADLNKINDERKEFEESYKQDLTRLREMKIKRANPQEIAKLEKEMKKAQKISANLGMTANRIAADLEYAKTETYLNSLIRKLQREQTSQPQDENENK